MQGPAKEQSPTHRPVLVECMQIELVIAARGVDEVLEVSDRRTALDALDHV